MKTKLQLTEEALEAAKEYIDYLEESFSFPENIPWNNVYNSALAALAAAKEESETVTLPRDTASTIILLVNFFGSGRELNDDGRAIYAEKAKQVTEVLTAALQQPTKG